MIVLPHQKGFDRLRACFHVTNYCIINNRVVQFRFQVPATPQPDGNTALPSNIAIATDSNINYFLADREHNPERTQGIRITARLDCCSELDFVKGVAVGLAWQ